MSAMTCVLDRQETSEIPLMPPEGVKKFGQGWGLNLVWAVPFPGCSGKNVYPINPLLSASWGEVSRPLARFLPLSWCKRELVRRLPAKDESTDRCCIYTGLASKLAHVHLDPPAEFELKAFYLRMSRRFLARKFLPSPGQQQMLLASRLNFFTASLFQRGKSISSLWKREVGRNFRKRLSSCEFMQIL